MKLCDNLHLGAASLVFEPAQLKLRDASFNEGPAGVANAVKKLWVNVGTYLTGMVRYAFSGGSAAIASKGGEPITGRDLVALLATIGIDLGLLALTALNPPAAAPARRDGLAGSQARLRLPTASVVRQLTSAIEMATARAPSADLEWVRRHFIHHDACSYFIIPNIYSVDQADKNEELRALAINQLAGVLDDLNLIRSLSLSELKRLAKEETRGSFSDLAPLRRRHDNAKSRLHVQAASWKNWVGTVTGNTDLPEEENRLRNHGLLSKAQRVLDIAGWSTAAQRDFEVFRLVDCDGLTPLLALFNEATLAQGADAIESVRKDQEALEDQRRLQIAHQRNA